MEKEFVKLERVVKKYKDIIAVNNISLAIKKGELVTLLGPSGCGKTTTLRLIAGLEIPDEGEILIGGEVVSSPAKRIHIPPHKRGIGMIFQNYAVWPHMTVYDNIAYGLKLLKLPKAEIKERVREVLEILDIADLEKRYPYQLSGGQQQRVALARALVIRPRLLLLDEPLSNLDAKLRERMRFEIRNIVKKFDLTAIYVTHDQAEALVISDRIVVMNKGVIEQVGRPEEIYKSPANRFVADFIGVANFVPIRIVKILENFNAIAETYEGIPIRCTASARLKENEKAYLMVRPENLLIFKEPPSKENTLPVKIKHKVYLGNLTYYWLMYNDLELRAQTTEELDLSEGDTVYIYFKPDKVVALPE
ncbi:MAG: ABC transporter ATP-binding protein [Desulfurococcaceae archaeon]